MICKPLTLLATVLAAMLLAASMASADDSKFETDADPDAVDIDSILDTEAPYIITDQPPSRTSKCWGPLGGLWFCPRPGVDIGYDDCADIYIDDIGISENTTRIYDTIRIAPTGWARLLTPATGGPDPTLAVHAGLAFLEMKSCLRRHGMDPDVRSWTSILQQLHCHMYWQLLGTFGGTTWDLEGHRSTTNNHLNVLDHGCNW